MTEDGWVKLTDEITNLGDDLYENAGICMPTATLYGVTQIGPDKYIAMRCSVVELQMNWPTDVAKPTVVCGREILQFMSKDDISKNTVYWPETDIEPPDELGMVVYYKDDSYLAINYNSTKVLLLKAKGSSLKDREWVTNEVFEQLVSEEVE